jgi:hypothetical protein
MASSSASAPARSVAILPMARRKPASRRGRRGSVARSSGAARSMRGWKDEPRRQDADHRVPLAVQGDAAADDRGIGGEAAAPERVAQHHDRLARVAIGEEAPERRARPEELEESIRGARPGEALGVAVAGQVDAGVRIADQRDAARRLEVLEVEDRERLGVAVGAIDLDEDHRVGVAVGQLAQEHGVDDAEDGGDRADATGQGQRRQRREGRPGAQSAERREQVLPESVHGPTLRRGVMVRQC